MDSSPSEALAYMAPCQGELSCPPHLENIPHPMGMGGQTACLSSFVPLYGLGTGEPQCILPGLCILWV